MAYAPLIMAGVSALSSYMSAAKQKKALAQRQSKIERLSSPEHLKEVIGQLMPFYRELVNSGLGPMFIQESARALSEAGLSGSGVGEALRGLSKATPIAMAAQEATAAGTDTVNRQIAGLSGTQIPAGNPLGEALAAGARAYFGASQAQRTQQQGSMDKVMNAPMVPADTTTPIQYPSGTAPLPNEPPLFPVASSNPLDRPGVNI